MYVKCLNIYSCQLLDHINKAAVCTSNYKCEGKGKGKRGFV